MFVRKYRGKNSDRGPSPNLWHNFPAPLIRDTPGDGFEFFEEFLNPPSLASATSQSGLITYQDAACTARGLATEQLGVLRLAVDATDNNEVSLSTGAGLAAMAGISDTAGSNYKRWFEARVRLGSIADQGVFVGLAEEGCAIANILADNTGAIADKDLVGFRILTADPDGIDAVYRINGGSEVVHKEEAQVAVASTWYKLGLYFDGTKLYYLVNGVIVDATGVTPGATFPDGEELCPLIAIKTGEAVAKNLDIDWIRYGGLAYLN